jgi:hypothetical protein
MKDILENQFPYKPTFFRISNKEEKDALNDLKKIGDIAFTYDEIERQIKGKCYEKKF